MQKRSGPCKGFTLVEMLIVVVIIGILAAALIPRLVGAQAAARDAARITALNNLNAAMSMYKSNNGTLPTQDLYYPASGIAGCVGTGVHAALKDIISVGFYDPTPKHINMGIGECEGKFGYDPILMNTGSTVRIHIGTASLENYGKNMNYAISGLSGANEFGSLVNTVDAVRTFTCNGVKWGTANVRNTEGPECTVNKAGYGIRYVLLGEN